MRLKVFLSVFFIHLFLAYVVPVVLALGFFVEATKLYAKFLAVLIFPVKIAELLGHPLDGWLVFIGIFFTALFWAFIFSIATEKILHR